MTAEQNYRLLQRIEDSWKICFDGLSAKPETAWAGGSTNQAVVRYAGLPWKL